MGMLPNDPELSKWTKIFMRELDWPTPLKRLPFNQMYGLICAVAWKYNCEVTQELIDAAKDAVQEIYSPGVEFEWPDDEAYLWWNSICPEHFKILVSRRWSTKELEAHWDVNHKPPSYSFS